MVNCMDFMRFATRLSYDRQFHLGLIELKPGTIIYARPLRDDGIYQEEDDIVEGWCLDGYVRS